MVVILVAFASWTRGVCFHVSLLFEDTPKSIILSMLASRLAWFLQEHFGGAFVLFEIASYRVYSGMFLVPE